MQLNTSRIPDGDVHDFHHKTYYLGGGSQRPFGNFLKIHPFWRRSASLSGDVTDAGLLDVHTTSEDKSTQSLAT